MQSQRPALVDARHVGAERLGQRQQDNDIHDELDHAVAGHEKSSGLSNASTRYTRRPNETTPPTMYKSGIRRLLQTLAELDEAPGEAEEQHAQSQIQEIHRGLLPSVLVATHEPTASRRQEVVKIGVSRVKRMPKSERSRVLSSFHR